MRYKINIIDAVHIKYKLHDISDETPAFKLV